MSITGKALELADLIKKTPEYMQLKAAKSIIDRDRKLRSDMEEYSRKQKEIYSGRYSAKEAEARLDELGRKFESLSKVPEIDQYLKAAGKFNEMISEVYKEINDSIAKDLK